MNTITTAEFQAHCVEILDRLDRGEIESLTITNHGAPIGVLKSSQAADGYLRPTEEELRSLNGFMRGSVIIPEGFDLTAPVLDEEMDAEKGILHR